MKHMMLTLQQRQATVCGIHPAQPTIGILSVLQKELHAWTSLSKEQKISTSVLNLWEVKNRAAYSPIYFEKPKLKESL